MYSRELQEKRPSPEENGIPLQGTWTQAFEEVDFLKIHRPYSFPIPKSLKRLRIKEWESFIVQDDRFYLHARFSNFKLYHSVFVIFHDREAGESFKFQKSAPGSTWQIPKSLRNSSFGGSSGDSSCGFFFRVHPQLEAESIKFELNIKKKNGLPPFTAQGSFDFAYEKTTPAAVSLKFSDRQSMYAYRALTAVNADIIYNEQHIHFGNEKTSGLFCDCKGYFPYPAHSSGVCGMGFDNSGRRFGFFLGENQAREPFKNNENALWIDGSMTPLPPVKITRGIEQDSDWVIQDMEGMVDLLFSPAEFYRDAKNFIFARTGYENILGHFNGKLLDSKGEELAVKNIFGTGEKLYLRV